MAYRVFGLHWCVVCFLLQYIMDSANGVCSQRIFIKNDIREYKPTAWFNTGHARLIQFHDFWKYPNLNFVDIVYCIWTVTVVPCHRN